MCLNNARGPFVAEKDITCYKALLTGLISEYKGYQYKQGVVHEAVLGPIEDYGYDQFVNSGFHSWAELPQPYVQRNPYLYIVLCTIPKGANYYIGTELGAPGYCSDTIIINDIAEEYKPIWYQKIIKRLKETLSTLLPKDDLTL